MRLRFCAVLVSILVCLCVWVGGFVAFRFSLVFCVLLWEFGYGFVVGWFVGMWVVSWDFVPL